MTPERIFQNVRPWLNLSLCFLLAAGAVSLIVLAPASNTVLGILAVFSGFCLTLGVYRNRQRLEKLRSYAVAQGPRVTDALAAAGFSQQERHAGRNIPDSAVANLFDELPVALIQIGEKDEVIRANRAARSMLKLRGDETPDFSEVVEGLGRSITAWLAKLRDRSALGRSEMVKVKRLQADVFLQVSFMYQPTDGKGSLIGVLSDATELKSLEAQFVQSQKMQAIGQLAGGVAHDFNNLLTAISGYCDLLLLRHENGDPDFGDLTQIAHNANRAAGLVGQLLAFSRKQTLQPKDIDVQETLRDLTHLLNRLVGEKTRLTFEGAEYLPRAYVDGRQLEQVIMNLVVNARDAMPDGGTISIDTRERHFPDDTKFHRVTVPTGRYVSIEVRDTGCGISKEVLPKIFEPFYSTKEVGEGTGLGLSTAYGIVKQTGGFIFADSTVGVGSVFTVLLPIFEGHAPAAVAKLPAPTVERGGLNGRVVLLVEDETPVRTFAARALRMNGTTVIEAASAEAALETLNDKSLHIDIVVSDVVMPGMDGPTWVKQALVQRPELKVVFVSGYAEESFAEEHARIPNSVFLPKPFSLRKLIETVQQTVS
jgi:two-component system cell cycle sensor histidine kinase/response regulator CckA